EIQEFIHLRFAGGEGIIQPEPFALGAFFARHHDHAVTAACAVQRRRSGAFQHRYAFDVFGVDEVEAGTPVVIAGDVRPGLQAQTAAAAVIAVGIDGIVVDGNAVHHDHRAVIAGEGGIAAYHHAGRAAFHAAGSGADLEAGHLTLQALRDVGGLGDG